MLAGRVLPPPHPRPPSPPAVTFYHIPRRYNRSNMQVGENGSSYSPAEDVKSPRSSRRGNRFYELRSAPTSSPALNGSKDDIPSPDSSVSSPKWRKKRKSTSHDDLNGAESGDGDSPLDSRTSNVSPAGSEEHVCLCQPEPKIPRPRNGKSDHSLSFRWRLYQGPNVTQRTKKFGVCLRTCIGKWG